MCFICSIKLSIITLPSKYSQTEPVKYLAIFSISFYRAEEVHSILQLHFWDMLAAS